LRDLQYEPTLVDDGIDPDELERLSYEPGENERHVTTLDKAERLVLETLFYERPAVATTRRLADAEAATVTTGWRAADR
jgi:hypothetical protein